MMDSFFLTRCRVGPFFCCFVFFLTIVFAMFALDFLHLPYSYFEICSVVTNKLTYLLSCF